MLISKKDLLTETGISYGQLYRWKRERLIPEEWFIKQSSFTGQETFFPREQVLNRIQAIQELKDKYSLEEMAKILSPEVADRGFTIADLQLVEEIPNEIIQTFEKSLSRDNFTYIEILLMVILSKVMEEEKLSLHQTCELLQGMSDFITDVKSTGYILVIYESDQKYYSVIYQEQARFFLDGRLRLVNQIRMDEVSNGLKIKYQDIFDFHVEENREGKEKGNKSIGKEIIGRESSGNESKKTEDVNSDIVLKFKNWEVHL